MEKKLPLTFSCFPSILPQVVVTMVSVLLHTFVLVIRYVTHHTFNNTIPMYLYVYVVIDCFFSLQHRDIKVYHVTHEHVHWDV
jgi:hypothetical protein